MLFRLIPICSLPLGFTQKACWELVCASYVGLAEGLFSSLQEMVCLFLLSLLQFINYR